MLQKSFVVLILLLLFVPSALAQEPTLTLTPISTYATGIFDEGAAEIVAYDPANQNLLVVNGSAEAIDVLNISDPANPVPTSQLDVSEYGSPTSVVM